MRKFDYNEYGVCTNPNIIRREVADTFFQIETALTSEVRWVYGYQCNLLGCGCGHPCVDAPCLPSYPTEQAAIHAACADIHRYMERNKVGSDPSVADKTSPRYERKLRSLLNDIDRPIRELSFWDLETQ